MKNLSKKKYDKNITIDELIKSGYTGLEAIEMLDIIKYYNDEDEFIKSVSWAECDESRIKKC